MADLAKSAEANKTPPALKDFYQTIYKASIQKWGRVDGQPIKAVAGQVLLVGISPAITGSPKNSGYGNVEYGSVQNQLNGMVTAKVITNIANNTVPNDPKYSFVNQSFLDEQQSNLEKLVMNLMR